MPTTGTPLNGSTLITGTSYINSCPANGTNYYALVAVDTSNNSSAPSTEANATVTMDGCGLQFDGSNDYVTFGQASGLGVTSFTIETWFKRTGAGVGTNTGSGGIASAIPLVTKGRAESEGSNIDMNYFLGIDTSNNKLVADFEEGAGGPGLLVKTIPSRVRRRLVLIISGITQR